MTLSREAAGRGGYNETVDLKRNTASSLGVVERIEYDPNRSSRIALVRWLNGIHLPNAKPPPPFSTTADVRGMFAFNSMLPPVGTSSRDVSSLRFSEANQVTSESLVLRLFRGVAVARQGQHFRATCKKETLRSNWEE
ncbi:Ribosomal Proteins L2, RNA binding domain [Sesbania bispinosa]|nr:Ribosomal Proteins L2, RNA binding domain [Sesbania bispinosa]